MVTTISSPQEAFGLANQRLAGGDAAGAELALTPLLARGLGSDPNVLALTGAIRLAQQRFAEAAVLFARARGADPRRPDFAHSHGVALAGQEKWDEALTAFRAATRIKPNFTAAWLDTARLQERLQRFKDAQNSYRKLLRAVPGQPDALLSLSGLLIDLQRADEAETLLRRALATTADPAAQAALRNNLAMALRGQNRSAEALAEFDQAERLHPGIPWLDAQRANTLEELKRHDEALALYRKMLAREPANPHWHQQYNDLLYRLGRQDDYLQSYERAPVTRDLQLGKAFFLSHGQRGQEAHAVYSDMLARDPHDHEALAGAARSLTLMGRFADASMAFDTALARDGAPAELFADAAQATLRAGDPEKAVALCERGLAADPHDQQCLSMIGLGWRMMGDEHDEDLSGYDRFVRAFDLEAPDGFSRMEDFNAELNAHLDSVHQGTGEYINQSLRQGSQTAGQLFGAGHKLVEKIRARIDGTVTRYIREMAADEHHPFLSRQARDFRYHGSWSARLRDCGFHINHIHPAGWISSAYYVQVPEVARDADGRQGWIKFGEPVFPLTLKDPIRRAIQPVPGRLVLFPSFMWHGTIPFHGPQRTTIAFDVVPKP